MFPPTGPIDVVALDHLSVQGPAHPRDWFELTRIDVASLVQDILADMDILDGSQDESSADLACFRNWDVNCLKQLGCHLSVLDATCQESQDASYLALHAKSTFFDARSFNMDLCQVT